MIRLQQHPADRATKITSNIQKTTNNICLSMSLMFSPSNVTNFNRNNNFSTYPTTTTTFITTFLELPLIKQHIAFQEREQKRPSYFSTKAPR